MTKAMDIFLLPPENSHQYNCALFLLHLFGDSGMVLSFAYWDAFVERNMHQVRAV
jgi:hypothetical protein